MSIYPIIRSETPSEERERKSSGSSPLERSERVQTLGPEQANSTTIAYKVKKKKEKKKVWHKRGQKIQNIPMSGSLWALATRGLSYDELVCDELA